MQRVGDTGDISLPFLAGANFWAISTILGHFWVIFGANFFGQKFISAIFITFCISVYGIWYWCMYSVIHGIWYIVNGTRVDS